MVTKNFKNLMACIIAFGGSNNGQNLLTVKDLSGNTHWIPAFMDQGGFPTICNRRYTSVATDAGVTFGSGGTAATENDVMLESPITTTDLVVTEAISRGVDSSGNPYSTITYSLTNNGASDITIREIGWKEHIMAAPTQSAAPTVTDFIKTLLDRTVLSTPLVVSAGGTGTLTYTLKAIVSSS